ncbi:MAG: hypothetical protein SP1CHLAM54_00590 [Chlamydiia bacterium]|nr:hypothetical protein [Chlamydiia bacterium]MCH9614981.1 hypothetical protein [Chlamydiia bacterium]MCH9629969.1 hypothetical protein [Chlamydiia bacterium]
MANPIPPSSQPPQGQGVNADLTPEEQAALQKGLPAIIAEIIQEAGDQWRNSSSS